MHKCTHCRSTHTAQLKEHKVPQEELDVYMESEEANYQLFSDSKTAIRRAAAEQVRTMG